MRSIVVVVAGLAVACGGAALGGGGGSGSGDGGDGDSGTASHTVVCKASSSATTPHVAWNRVAGTHYDDIVAGAALDPSGNIVLAGHGNQGLNFGCGAIETADTNYQAAVLAKLSPTGDCIFTKAFASGYDELDAVGTDASGAIYVIGKSDFVYVAPHRHGIDVGCGFMATPTDTNILLAKYSSDGQCQWSKALSSTNKSNDSFGKSIAVDANGDFYWVGWASHEIALCETTFTGPNTLFAKFDGATGDCLWAHHFRQDANESDPASLALDSSGDVYLTGTFYRSLDLGGGPLVGAAPKSIPGYIAKFTSAGHYVWALSTGADADSLYLATDASGGVAWAGTFFGTINLGKGGFTSTNAWNGFIAWLDADGHQVGLERLGTDQDVVSDMRVATDGCGHTIAASLEGPFDAEDTLFIRKYDDGGGALWKYSATGVALGALLADGDSITFGGGLSSTGTFGTPRPMRPIYTDALVFRLTP